MVWQTGDHVHIAMGASRIDGVITLASSNGRSLMLTFEGILLGHVGMMPVLMDHIGTYRSIVTHEAVTLSALQ